MEYQIYPLGLTQVDWKRFIQTSQSILGFSPTRGLDSGILPKHTDPAAFLSCLDFENDPQNALREGRRTGLSQHYFVSFIGIVDEDVLLAFGEKTRVSVLSRRGHREHVVILSATMDIWYDAVSAGCRKDADWSFRICSNIIYDILIKMSFHIDGRKQELQDGTFILA